MTRAPKRRNASTMSQSTPVPKDLKSRATSQTSDKDVDSFATPYFETITWEDQDEIPLAVPVAMLYETTTVVRIN